MDLAGKTCVITGATQGIGRALITELAGRKAQVAFCARTEASVTETVEALRRAGNRVLGMVADVSDETGVTAFSERVHAEFGPADIVVNNAGIGYFAELQSLSIDRFDEMFRINVRGVFLVTRAFLPDMIQRRQGTIVNIASLAGKNGFVGGTGYAATKHAVLGFSRSLMLEVRRHNVRVVSICPGSVDTPFFEKAGQRLSNPDRVLSPEDVARLVIAALEVSEQALVSELEVRPTDP